MEQKQKHPLSAGKVIFIDGLAGKIQRPRSFDFPLYQFVKKNKSKSILFSRKGITECFFSPDSNLYLTKEECRKFSGKERTFKIIRRIDSLSYKEFEKNRIYSIGKDKNYFQIKRRYNYLRNYLVDVIDNSVQGVSMTKMWNISVVGAVIFGMITMTMVYRYLGGSVSAKMQETKISDVSLEENYSRMANKDFEDEIDPEFMTKLLSDYDKYEKESEAKKAMEKTIREMVKGYPIEKMVPYIAEKDKIVAALLVAIGKKESNWGKRVPVLKGEDCFNYWGYRGKREKMGTGGHTCFDSPKDAVDTVAKRIEFLVSNEKLNTPAKMVVWKCGYDCSWDSKAAVRKWISDVDLYFKKLNK